MQWFMLVFVISPFQINILHLLEHALRRIMSDIYFWIPQMLLIDLKKIEKIMEAFKKGRHSSWWIDENEFAGIECIIASQFIIYFTLLYFTFEYGFQPLLM